MMFLLASVNTTIRLGGTGVDLTSASSVQQLISTTMTSIHYFALAIALCIFLLAIVRQYTQFAEHMGVRFIGSLLVVLVMIFSFPKICDAVQNATYSYSQGTSMTMENMFCWLTEQKPNAGKKTLKALEKAYQNGEKASPDLTAAPDPTPAPEEQDPDLNPKISGPSVSSIQLLSWYDVVKPSISNGQHLLVYEPSSGLSWTVRVLARGRHCDAEPLTARDTRTMVKAFGGINTWNQKGVYVQLPDGRWSVASTHDMPHESSTIKDNDFNGHLCVHFLRTMEEAKKNDPNYGVANQETIRQILSSYCLIGPNLTTNN